MWEHLLFILVGAFLALIGSVVQTIFIRKSERKVVLSERREKAYLGYIDALLKLKIDHDYRLSGFEEFFNNYRKIESELRLYGSERAKKHIKKYQELLDEAWEINNENGAIEEIDNIIEVIRKELGIE